MELYDQVTLAQKGNKEAFAALVYERKQIMYKTAYIYVKNKEDALDIVSEAVYRAYTNIQKLKKPDAFNTYLTKILINCAYDFIRKEKKSIKRDEQVFISGVSEDKNVDEKLDLYAAVDRLSSKYKTVVILKYFRDMTFEDISSIMGCPVGTVKTYLNRALKALRISLREGGEL